MAKQDVIDAINATIVPNGSKAINADSLRNLLIMMAENAGEGGSGSGDGALRVIVPETMVVGPIIAEAGELSPLSWEAMRPELETSLGGVDLSEYEAAVNASFTHNANVHQQIFAKARTGQGVSIVLDQTPYCHAMVNIMLEMNPEMGAFVEEALFSSTQPAGFVMQYTKYTPEGESQTGMSELIAYEFSPVGMLNSDSMGVCGYSSNMVITLNSDGSLHFTSTETDTESGS